MSINSSETHDGQAQVSSAQRLARWAAVIAIATFALVPLSFNPDAVLIYVPAAFYLIKFKLLMTLSGMLLIVVLGATLSGARPVKLPVLFAALTFLGISTLSTIFSGSLWHSLVGETNRHDGLLTLAAGVLLFYALGRFLDSWSRVRACLTTGLVSATLIAVYGILQTFSLDPVLLSNIPWYTVDPGVTRALPGYPDSDRAFSTLGWPLWLAAYLTLMMGAVLALYFLTVNRWMRFLCLVSLALLGACWLYTYTRGAILGVGLALPVIVFLGYRRLGRIRPLLLPITVVLIAVVTAELLSPYSMTALGRLGAANIAPTAEEIPTGGDLSVSTRLLMWRDTIPMIAERPVLGHGPDNFARPFERYEGEDLRAFFPNGERIDKAHNELLQVAATTGLLGLAAYLWVFVSYFRSAYQSGGWPLLAISGGVLAYLLQLQTAFTTIGTGVAFWSMLGVSVAIMRLRDDEHGEAPGRYPHK